MLTFVSSGMTLLQKETIMKTTRIAAALALLLTVGTARAQSFIPGNNVDDFGPSTYHGSTTTRAEPLIASHASPIPANGVDDFGPLTPTASRTEEELGAAGGEPGMEAKAAERSKEKAAVAAYARERFLRETWAPLP